MKGCPVVAFSVPLLILVSGVMLQAMGAGKEKHTPVVTQPPREIVRQFNLSPFYKKFVSAGGIPIVGSEKVSDYAFLEAAYIINNMLAGREDLRQAIIRNKIRVAIMAPTELTTDITEFNAHELQLLGLLAIPCRIPAFWSLVPLPNFGREPKERMGQVH